MNPCIFCSIIDKKIPASIVAEDTSTIVIRDITPKAPVHLLVIPKNHVVNMASISPDKLDTVKDMTLMVQTLAQQHPQFNLICNNGPEAGQTVMHLHWHFLSGVDFFKKYL